MTKVAAASSVPCVSMVMVFLASITRQGRAHSFSALIAIRALSNAGRIMTVWFTSGAGIMSTSVEAADDSVNDWKWCGKSFSTSWCACLHLHPVCESMQMVNQIRDHALVCRRG